MRRLRKIEFDEEAPIVDHLEELRTRLIVAGVVLGLAFALCFWQNHLVLAIANAPLPDGRDPITLGVSEPFMATVKLCCYAGLLLALPALLYLTAGFVLPALSPEERRTITPFLVAVPVLFTGGVVFSYFVIVPAATKFLLHFNQDQFDIQIRASQYYGFLLTTLMALGLVFELPLGILAVTRLGICSPDDLASNRRYAVLAIAVVAMLLPGTDPVTMLISMAPLLLLFELSVQLSKLVAPKGSGAGAVPGSAG